MEQPKAMEYGSRKASPDVLKPHTYICILLHPDHQHVAATHVVVKAKIQMYL